MESGVQNDAVGVPPSVHATPADMPEAYDPRATFWMPSAGESARLLGWRWIIVGAMALIAGLLAWAVASGRGEFLLGLSGLVIKLAGVVVATVVSLWVWMLRSATRFRTDPFCIHCGYSMAGHNDGDRCPECGRLCSFAVSREYKRDPHWFIKRYRKRGEAPLVESAALDAGRGQTADDGTR